MITTSLTNKQFLLLVDEVETEDNSLASDNFSETSGDEDVFVGINDDNQRTIMAQQLRAELDRRMSSKDQPQISGCNAPAGTSHMVHHMMGKFNHRKTKGAAGDPKTIAYLQKQREYRQYFPASEIKFTFPSEAWTTLPSPHYHALQKTSWIHVDWGISHPGATLRCFECEKKEPRNEPPQLVHDRTNFTKSRHLFPIFDQGGSVIWASVMSYCCPNCSTRYPGNDGRLLQMLDPHVRSAYPVHPRHALEGATWHLTRELADDLDAEMLTYGNADEFSHKMHNRKFREYEERMINYYSCEGERKHKDYIPIRDWVGEFPPDGTALRTLHERAERSSLTHTKISNFHRHKLEIQSVGCSKVFAIDWTFAVCKNYILPGATACFTSMVETGEVCALGLVATTKVAEIAHLVEQTRRRPNFKPKAIFTDTWPHNQKFWFMIFGPITGCLGIFHFMKRMVDTLRSNHFKYWDALIALKKAIYRYETSDYQELCKSLTTGTMAKDKKCYTPSEIQELRYSKKWKQRYAKYLRKVLHRGSEIQQGLLDWKREFKDQVDPTTGLKLFTADTKSAVDNQIKHVEDIQFPLGIEMYKTIPPGPRSTHNLSSYRSINPEPMLESWHGRFAHFGNRGMKPGLADILHLRGTAHGNVVVRHKLSMMNEEENGALTSTLDPPGHLREQPVLKDHCLGKFINELAAKAGAKAPYRNLRPVFEDNGEDFLSEYYEQQKLRNKDPRNQINAATTKRCGCKSCGGNQVMLVNEVIERGQEEDLSDDEVITEVREVDEATGDSRTLTLAVTRAKYVVEKGLNVAVKTATYLPIAPNVPIAMAQTAPATTMQAFHFADNEICCMPFFLYKANQNSAGRCKPGPRPHDKRCPNYRQRKARMKAAKSN